MRIAVLVLRVSLCLRHGSSSPRGQAAARGLPGAATVALRRLFGASRYSIDLPRPRLPI